MFHSLLSKSRKPSRRTVRRRSLREVSGRRRMAVERLEIRNLLAGLSYSADFTQSQVPGAVLEQQWNDFRSQLTPSQYTTVTISGSNDPTGRMMHDPVVVPQLAAAIQDVTSFHHFDGTRSWNVSTTCVSGGGTNSDLSVYDSNTASTAVVWSLTTRATP